MWEFEFGFSIFALKMKTILQFTECFELSPILMVLEQNSVHNMGDNPTK